ncbi:hypothetical protein CLV98_108127 [Dyadobacter jejuensis]|uniref:Uncharacterized protein n=1 Tax=Dyadobacter jejuensis TaxID=1082580 RepID=A0A316B3R4_9BACT|nr:hypothetical protein [Dyadobacter jejuensis]PWJ57207.1 hypothetical protein CLV98_108127 [Dyadobacter jejuensis]
MKNSDKNKKEEKEEFEGYPLYPSKDDVYNRGLVEREIDPEDTDHLKKWKKENPHAWNEKDFEQDLVGDDLDVPGAELDDADEIIGNEDEENNYYSLGGDNHNDLEENRGD